jgi:hypothetical protein
MRTARAGKVLIVMHACMPWSANQHQRSRISRATHARARDMPTQLIRSMMRGASSLTPAPDRRKGMHGQGLGAGGHVTLSR